MYSSQGDLPDGPDLSSAETLTNPLNPRVTIVHAFLDNALLKDVITDTHFSARDRMGRTLVFMARILQDGRAHQFRILQSTNAQQFFLNRTESQRSSERVRPISWRPLKLQKYAKRIPLLHSGE